MFHVHACFCGFEFETPGLSEQKEFNIDLGYRLGSSHIWTRRRIVGQPDSCCDAMNKSSEKPEKIVP